MGCRGGRVRAKSLSAKERLEIPRKPGKLPTSSQKRKIKNKAQTMKKGIAIALFVLAATFLFAEWPEIRLFDFHGWSVFGFFLAYFVGYFFALGYFGRLMNWWRGNWQAMK